MTIYIPLTFDAERRLLFCTTCRQALNPARIEQHLRLDKHKYLPDDLKRDLRGRFEGADACSPIKVSVAEVINLFALGPIPYLDVVPGYRCQYCEHAVHAESSARKHLTCARPAEMATCHVLQLSPRCPFVVVPPDLVPPSTTSGPASASWTSVLDEFECEFGELQRRPPVVDPDEVGHVPIWDQRTGWLEWFRGLVMDDLVPLCSLDAAADDPFNAPLLREWIQRTFFNFSQFIFHTSSDQSGGNLLRRLVHAYEDNNCQAPVEELTPSSLEKYTLTMTQVIVCTLRLVALPASERAQFRTEITDE